MGFTFDDETPIYLQIIEHIKMQIISGKYNMGDKLPSVRDFSADLAVNPNTVQKALGELESIGLIYTERTNGKFVTKDKKKIEKLKALAIKVRIDKFFDSMQKIGLSKQEIIDVLQNMDKE